MSYLTDTEKRLLFSALSREKEVCKQVDKGCCREPYEQSLESVIKGLERKFYYDRFEKEIRAKAIDEFADQLKKKYEHCVVNDILMNNDVMSYTNSCSVFESFIDEIAEEMRGAG